MTAQVPLPNGRMGLPAIRRWQDVPDHLKTKTQLKRERLRPAPGQQPAAVFIGRYNSYDLYDKHTAVAIQELTPERLLKARQAIEAARAARACVDCGTIAPKDDNGRCRDCARYARVQATTQQAVARLQQLALDADWIVLDTETTGLDGQAEIVQVGIVDANGKQLMNQLVKPLKPIPFEATAVHGITNAHVSKAPGWRQIYPDLVDIVAGRRVLVFNADFDGRMIRQTCEQHDLRVPKIDWECVMLLVSAVVGDWSTTYKDFRYISLERAYFGFVGNAPDLKAHDALHDAIMTAALVRSFEKHGDVFAEATQ